MKWKYKMTKNKVGFYTISSKSQKYFKNQDRQQFDGTLIYAIWAGVFWGMKEPQKGMHSQRRGPGWTPWPWVQQHEALRISMKWQLLGCGSYCPLDTVCPVNAHMLEAWSPVCWRQSSGALRRWSFVENQGSVFPGVSQSCSSRMGQVRCVWISFWEYSFKSELNSPLLLCLLDHTYNHSVIGSTSVPGSVVMKPECFSSDTRCPMAHHLHFPLTKSIKQAHFFF